MNLKTQMHAALDGLKPASGEVERLRAENARLREAMRGVLRLLARRGYGNPFTDCTCAFCVASLALKEESDG